jgi:NADP-dependent 3-hydroxy acid dehydrogenase YdfG
VYGHIEDGKHACIFTSVQVRTLFAAYLETRCAWTIRDLVVRRTNIRRNAADSGFYGIAAVTLLLACASDRQTRENRSVRWHGRESTILNKVTIMIVFENQVALVSGASGGIGGAIATHLIRQGATVYLTGRNQEKLRELSGILGSRAIAFAFDLTRDETIDGLVEEVKTRFGRLDILVHCAGAYARDNLTAGPVATLDKQFSTNIRGPFRLTQGLIPLLKLPRGQIVFINSSVGIRPSPKAPQFSLTQHAFRAMADGLRHEVNADGIRVMSVYPGRTATRRIARLSAQDGSVFEPTQLLQPQDIANVVVNALSLPWTAEVTNIQIRPMLKSY